MDPFSESPVPRCTPSTTHFLVDEDSSPPTGRVELDPLVRGLTPATDSGSGP